MWTDEDILNFEVEQDKSSIKPSMDGKVALKCISSPFDISKLCKL